jgi:hypothetical protein
LASASAPFGDWPYDSKQAFDEQEAAAVGGDNHEGAGDPMALARHCHRDELERLNQACWNGEDQQGLIRPQPLDVTARRSLTISENTHHV